MATLPAGIAAASALPISKSIWGSTLLTQMVSVQPMTNPCGSVFYLDYVYGKDTPMVKKMKKLLRVIKQSHRHFGHEEEIIKRLTYWILCAEKSFDNIEWDGAMKECNELYKHYKDEYNATIGDTHGT